MAKARVAMNVIKEFLRLHHECGRSQREIARSYGLSAGAVNKLLRLAGQAGVTWPLPAGLDEAQLEERLYGRPAGSARNRQLGGTDFAAVHKELKAHKNLTLQRVWLEYRERHPDGYSYSQYCERNRQWKSRQDLVMLQEHKAGENLFVDYAGQTVLIGDVERRVARGRDLRGGARREFVPLRGGELGPGRGVVGEFARAGLRVLRRCRGDAGALQPEVGRSQGLPLRAGAERQAIPEASGIAAAAV